MSIFLCGLKEVQRNNDNSIISSLQLKSMFPSNILMFIYMTEINSRFVDVGMKNLVHESYKGRHCLFKKGNSGNEKKRSYVPQCDR